MGMTLKWLTKHAIRDVAEAVIGEVPATFTEEVLKRMLQRMLQILLIAWHSRRECHAISKILMSLQLSVNFTENCNDIRMTSLRSDNILAYIHIHIFIDKLSCASALIAIIYPAKEIKSIHALRKNINTVAMLTRDALLYHFRKRMFHRRIGSCTL